MKTAFQPRLAIAATLAALALIPLRADEENLLSYSADTGIVPKGHWETYHWLTLRAGKSSGQYRVTDYFAEFEYGLTGKSQVSLYLTAANYDISGVPGYEDRDSTRLTGARVAYKHLFRDPEGDGYGLALYLEPTYSARSGGSGQRHDEFGLEAKLIYQLESADEKRNYTANLTLEPEMARAAAVTKRELKVEFSHGASFRVCRRWHAGLENRWVAVFDRWQIQQAGTHAGFIGPVVHYGGARWWFTATWLRQFSGWPATRHGLALDEFTRDEFRLKFGLEF